MCLFVEHESCLFVEHESYLFVKYELPVGGT